MTEPSYVLIKTGDYHWTILILHQIIIIITLIPRYYLTNMDISDDGSICRDVNNSGEEEINDQGSQDDSKNMK